MITQTADTTEPGRRTAWRAIRALAMVAVMLVVGVAQARQSDRRPPDSPDELRSAMQEYFAKRLRAELSLSDDQFEEIVPLVHRMEETKRSARRVQMESIRRLRQGLTQGASDAELQEALDGLEQSELDQQEDRRAMLRKIDRVLSTRQRVQLRFFTQRFRRDIQDKVQELRGERAPRRRPNRRRP